MEKKKKARTLQLKRRLFKVRIESSTDKSSGDQEDASKHGRNEDQDDDISWFQKDVQTQWSTPPTTTTITTLIEDKDLTIAQTLMKMRSEKLKEKAKEKGVSSKTAKRLTSGVVMKEVSETTTRSIVPPQTQLLAKVAQRLQEELDEEVRLEREREEGASNAALIEEWDNVQAMMDADYELATGIQTQERGELTIKERSKLFVELINERKKHFARLRAEEKRRKPPTKKVVKGSKKKAESSGKKSASKKRAG
ncbi:hypothetical protein Tco_0057507, partial [Tanacetum coccineum]